MKKTKVVIQVKGGIVQHIASNNDIDIVLIDWDNINAGDEYPTEQDIIEGDSTFEDINKFLNENKDCKI